MFAFLDGKLVSLHFESKSVHVNPNTLKKWFLPIAM